MAGGRAAIGKSGLALVPKTPKSALAISLENSLPGHSAASQAARLYHGDTTSQDGSQAIRQAIRQGSRPDRFRK